MGQKKVSQKQSLPNDGYIYPAICGSCLKLWVDDEPAEKGGDEEKVNVFGKDVPVRQCPRCAYEMTQ